MKPQTAALAALLGLTERQAAAMAYATRHTFGELPEGRAVPFTGKDGTRYRIQATGAFRLVRSAEHWTLNRWHKVDRIPVDAMGETGTEPATPSHLIVSPKAPAAFRFGA